jgi:hypothetical protein
MVYQNLQLLYAAGSYVNLQDQSDIAVGATTGNFSFHVTRVGLEDKPVTISLIPMENIQSAGSSLTISTLPNYYDTYSGNVSYTLMPSISAGKRIRFAWKIETGGYSWYDTVTKFYNPIQLLYDNMEGASVTANWTVSGGWDYTNEAAYAGSKSLTESPGGNYTANSTRRATYTGSFDLSDATAACMSFWVKHRAENFYDKLQVKVSNDNGTTWTAIPGTTTVQEPGTLDGSTLNGNPSLTGIKEDWTRELFDLKNWLGSASLRLRFEFTSGPNNSFDYAQDDGFHIDNLKVIKSTTPLITLPVHFINFTGKLLPDNTVLLQWQAVTDDHHDYFQVERSLDGVHFTTVGKGPSEEPFRLIDPFPVLGDNFYRVKQVDKDGTTTYSSIVNVPFSMRALAVNIYPNPATDHLRVRVESDGRELYAAVLVDGTGRTVRHEEVVAGVENNFSLTGVAAGIYVLQLRNRHHSVVASQLIVKQ